MKLKKSFIGIITVALLSTGCSFNNSKSVEPVADEATQQKTMTKVQNNVNEIMNKDYDYVLKNMGSPYYVSYYIEDKNMVDIDNVEKFSKTKAYVGLSYPKYTLDRELEGSALYIGLENNKVTEVKTYDLMTYDIKEEAISTNTDIIVDIYSLNSNISLNLLDKITFEDYIEENIDEFTRVIGGENPSFEVYDKTINQKIKGYLIEDNKDESEKMLTVYESDDKVIDIKILDNNKAIDIVEKHLRKD